ncbi:IQ domain-containing protein E isoform X2 [Pleurodeles waltl]|uniref:IQ domain-containing protein E isoform X2 n=1 Tax=Pleurodeles waltl TaxID=8319 RepID=UPI0037097955
MSWAAGETGSDILALGLDLGDDGMSAGTYESDTERQKKKKSSPKPPRSPKSPYLSSSTMHSKKSPVWRSLKGTGFKHTENPMAKMPRNMWLSSLKQRNGLNQPVKSNIDTGQAWVRSSSSTPEYLKEALGMKKPKYSRSASNGYIPGTPDYKEKEDMYDEIIELKKTLQVQRSEGDVLKTKLRRLEEENSKKDRQIEQLLDPSKGSEFSRSLVDKRNDSSVVINGLKQKILRLEQQCKEKDNLLNKLQTELKTTSLEEMKIAMETYYVEIQRLQILLAKAETEKTPPENKTYQKHQKPFSVALAKLSKNVKDLQEENQSLKVDLERALGSSPTSNESKVYSDWSKQRLVRRVSELEKKLNELDSTKSQQPDQAKLANVASNLKAEVKQDSFQTTNVAEESERLRGLIKNLKGDRSALQTKLAEKDSEMKQSLRIKNDLEKELKKLEAEKEKNRKEIQQLTEKVKSLEKAMEDECKKRAITEQTYKEQREYSGSRGASPQSRPSTAKRDDGREEGKEEEAAEIIQTHWRQYKASKEIDDFDKSPSAVRSSVSTSSPPDPSAEEEAVTMLQSAFRAHVARAEQHERRASISSSIAVNSSSSRNLKDTKSASHSPRRSSPQAFSVTPDNGDSDVSEELIEEPVPEDEKANKWKNPKDLKFSPRQQLPAQQYNKERTRSFSPASNDLDSDDSDDIIISPSLRTKR